MEHGSTVVINSQLITEEYSNATRKRLNWDVEHSNAREGHSNRGQASATTQEPGGLDARHSICYKK
jgi:hypothetical protein